MNISDDYIFIDEYWKNFEPIDIKLHYLNGVLYFVFGLMSIFANLMVLYYLFK